METDLHVISTRLKELSKLKPSPSRVEEVDHALRSKHEGINVCAAKTLGAWGDEESVNKLKVLIEKISSLEARWGAASAISDSLAPHLIASDIPWVVNLILRHSKSHNHFVLYSLFRHLPRKETLAQIEIEEDRGGINRKEARYAKNSVNRYHT